jgi:hypothetical protein
VLGGEICRWLLLFQEYDFEIIVKPGRLNIGPDQGKFEGQNFAHGLFFDGFFQKKIHQFALFEAPFCPILMGYNVFALKITKLFYKVNKILGNYNIFRKVSRNIL